MSVNAMKVRSLYESRTASSGGRMRFLTEMRHAIGVADKNGNDLRDTAGNKRLGERALRPEQFSLQELAEGIIGASWRDYFDPARGGSMSRANQMRSIVESGNPGDQRALLESTGIGIDPTAFLNINTFTALVGGLIEVKILEAFQNPDLIADKLAPAEPTKLNGQKMIGVTGIGDRSKKRLPGEPHPRAQFGERWIETPETREIALAVDVLKESVFFDLTGDVLSMASQVGEELAYRKELEVLSTVVGATNSFRYNGTAYNTYSAAKQLGIVNEITNPLLDWTSFQNDVLQFMRFEDPHTSKRILVRPNTVLVNPAKLATANLILNASTIERRTGQGATPQQTANPLYAAQGAANPFGGQFDVITSPLLEQVCLSAAADGGLALSQGDTDELWFMMEKGKSFRYMQNYPLTVTQAAPNNYEMLDKGLVASYFANERGIPAVISPWHVLKNKGS